MIKVKAVNYKIEGLTNLEMKPRKVYGDKNSVRVVLNKDVYVKDPAYILAIQTEIKTKYLNQDITKELMTDVAKIWEDGLNALYRNRLLFLTAENLGPYHTINKDEYFDLYV